MIGIDRIGSGLYLKYIGTDNNTYGHCPTCGGIVQNGIGYSEKVCHTCGQHLKWDE